MKLVSSSSFSIKISVPTSVFSEFETSIENEYEVTNILLNTTVSSHILKPVIASITVSSCILGLPFLILIFIACKKHLKRKKEAIKFQKEEESHYNGTDNINKHSGKAQCDNIMLTAAD